MDSLKKISIVTLALSITACGQPIGTYSASEENPPPGTTEADLNAPVDGTDGLTPDRSADPVEKDPIENSQTYFFPSYKAEFGIPRNIFDDAKKYYDQHWSSFENRRYVMIIDMGQHSSKKRFLLIDLKTGTYERHNVSHGSGSDTNNDGYAESFSNTEGSKKTSLGFYKTLYTYNGTHGRSLRLDGLSSTNSNALARAIVVHGASYVSDSSGRAGRSWGCPALDEGIVQGVIDRVRNGAMMYIASSR
ncbi:MAG: murein L,D-transpeptidase catalytic domain family protein [Bdellovibrionales bacterium]